MQCSSSKQRSSVCPSVRARSGFSLPIQPCSSYGCRPEKVAALISSWMKGRSTTRPGGEEVHVHVHGNGDEEGAATPSSALLSMLAHASMERPVQEKARPFSSLGNESTHASKTPPPPPESRRPGSRVKFQNHN
jgi:hypothetical protein